MTAIRPTTSTNRTVSAGTTIDFGCETNAQSKIRWIFDSSRSRLPQVLYSGYAVVSSVAWRISVNTTARENVMTVTNVNSNDSGVYSCHTLQNFTRKVNFHLLVTGTSSSSSLSSSAAASSFICSKRQWETTVMKQIQCEQDNRATIALLNQIDMFERITGPLI